MPHMPAPLHRILSNRRGAGTWGAARPPAAFDAAARAQISELAAANQIDEYHAAVRRIIEQARGPR